MSQGFYKFLEDKHRGSRELILSRLGFYKQFIIPIKNTLSSIQAIDLGCGRGEWLELVTDAGYTATGIDIESGMLADCIVRGLNVQNRDALEYLKTQSANSVAIVSGFHIVEHLPFEYLMELVQEALRVLVPGGLLILETPNSENIMVGTDSFYVDPTHIKPVPHHLLSIIPEFAGFYRIKTVRLQENPAIMKKENFSLIDVFSGVSPDYAIIAQKNGDDSQLKVLDHAFDCEYGIQLSELCAFYDKRMMEYSKGMVVEQNKKIESSIDDLSRLLQCNLDKYNNLSLLVIQDANDKLDTAEEKILQLENEITKLKEQMKQEVLQAKEQAEYWYLQSDRWYKQILAIHASTSWIITKPIRIIKRISNGTLAELKPRSLSILKSSVIFIVDVIKRYPRLWRMLRSTIIKHPKLHALALRLKSGRSSSAVTQKNKTEQIDISLSPREKEILGKIQFQLDKYKSEGM